VQDGTVSSSIWHRRSLLALLVATGAFLAWLIVRHSLPAYLAATAPETALLLNPAQPTALVEVAERQLRAELSRVVEARSGASTKTGRQQPVSRFAFQNAGGATSMDAAGQLDRQDTRGQPASPAADTAVTRDIRETRASIRTHAGKSLLSDPVNARAYRVLALLAELEGDKTRQSELMRAAAKLSLRDVVTVLWAMQDGYSRKDYGATLRYADVMFRTQPQLEAYFVPLLARLAETREGRPELTAVLGRNPPWRAMFFASLPRYITDARTPFGLLSALKTSPAPPTSKEVADYLQFLIQRNLHDLAYYTWLQLLPADQLARAGYLFNGSFEQDLTTAPFDWQVNAGSGVTVDIQPRPDNASQRALRIEFGHGRVEFGALYQLTMLAPGKYTFSGVRQGSLAGRRGLLWRVQCTQGSQQIGISKMDLGIFPKWQPFSFEFTVPVANCRSQRVMLMLAARSTSERLLTGTIFYDDLQIERSKQLPQ
jgi:hypothetical protein